MTGEGNRMRADLVAGSPAPSPLTPLPVGARGTRESDAGTGLIRAVLLMRRGFVIARVGPLAADLVERAGE